MIKKITLLTTPCFALMFCVAFKTQQHNALYKQLIGEWRNIYLKINTTPGKSDNVGVAMEADSSNWEQRLKIKPIRTHFKADGSYYSEYINLKDSVIKKPTGTWSVKADTIIMVQLTPDKSETRLRVSITGDVATFSGMVDFDGNGKGFVEYYGKQRKFK